MIEYSQLNTRQIDALDRGKTVIIIPGAILGEHGPYLPSGSDGIFNNRMARDLAESIATRRGWSAILLPTIPLGTGPANEIGGKYSFPGSISIRPETLRSIFMDIADQLGNQRFRWVFVVHGHGDPAHNRMLDQAGDYFHDTYGGQMINVFGHLWAMDLTDFRTANERRRDGLPEHATMIETSVILALAPGTVASDVRSAKPNPGASIQELERISSAPDWPGYFGNPSAASESLGLRVYGQWLIHAKELVNQVLSGMDLGTAPRLAEMQANDPADAAAEAVNRRLEQQHQAWLNQHMASED